MALSAVGRKALLPHGSQRKIARQLGIEESRVSAVVNGQDIPLTEHGWKSYKRVQKAIAKALGLPAEDSFQDFERGEVQPQEMAS